LRRLALLAVVLCSVVAGCKEEDTKDGRVWARTVESRLTPEAQWRPCRRVLRTGRVVAEADCGFRETMPPPKCPAIVESAAAAVRLVAFQPVCIDAAIETLEKFSSTDPDAMNDLAAAYYVRAQRADDPLDLLRAFDATTHALASKPQPAGALFNRALVLEAIGLANDAIKAWDAVARSEKSPQWAAEARDRRDRLQRDLRVSAADEWSRNAAQIPALLRAGNASAITPLLARFATQGDAYFAGLLMQWAASPTDTNFAGVRTFAAALTPVIRDRYALDIVDTLRDSRAGLLERDPARAIALLDAAKSPVSFVRRFGIAKQTADARGLAMLDAIETDARSRGHRHLLAPTFSLRGTILAFQGRYIESLAAYDAAIAEYAWIDDESNVLATRNRRAGALRQAGQSEGAWRDAVATMRSFNRLVEVREKHVALAAAAQTALAAGHPRAALLFQDEAVNLYRQQPHKIELAIALRVRAEIEIAMGDYDAAERDLAESSRSGRGAENAAIASLLRVRAQEARGMAWMATDPRRAVAAFTDALQLTPSDYSTFRATLLARRAEAYRKAGTTNAADADVRVALAIVRNEETLNLRHRVIGPDDQLSRGYFSRFQEIDRFAIGQSMDARQPLEALVYAERARAAEPLNLVERRGIAPDELQRDLNLASLQSALPARTLLIEYALLDDRIIAWLVTRDRFNSIVLPVSREEVERRVDALQRSVSNRNDAGFETQSRVLHELLIEAPLKVAGVAPRRLVIIPDGAMYGIPFAAVRDKKNRFLIERAPIETAGSAKLYMLSLDRDRSMPANRRVAVLGDPAFNTQSSLMAGFERLPNANHEADAIKALYGAEAEVRKGVDATIPQLLALAPVSGTVHIGAHAIVNSREPASSFIALAPAGGDSGLLDTRQLLTKITLDETRLVILGACSSAGGLPIGPEGVAPFVRPLIGAGVPAVIGTLWSVNDATAEDLLVSFHRHYRQGSDAAVALQAAQIELLRKPSTGGTPVMQWAPFQVIGHASSPFAPAINSEQEKPP
jgi:CHAT domain-containing protein